MTGVVRVGLLGLGTVGSSVYQLVKERAPDIERRAGCAVTVSRVLVRDPSRTRTVDVDRAALTTDARSIIESPDIDLVVELLGGERPALEYILAALESGKAVVTANKEVVAAHGAEIFDAAARHGVDIFFEGSVAGGIPIVQPIKVCLAANRIDALVGILNGTTNYILTRMANDGMSFAAALKEAQQLGYAEADPSKDVDGHDAASKLAILASIAFSNRIKPADVYREGIAGIDPLDIVHVRDLGYVLKLLAIARRGETGLEARVHPTLIPAGHPLAAVSGVFNAIYIKASSAGELMFYGRGAGGMATASAVVGDIIEAARNLRRGIADTSCTCYHHLPVLSVGGATTSYYLRVATRDVPGAVARLAAVLAGHQVGLARVMQKPGDGRRSEVVLITAPAREEDLAAAVQQLRRSRVVTEVPAVLRVESLEEGTGAFTRGVAAQSGQRLGMG